MPTQPLQPFTPPAQVLGHLPVGAIPAGTMLTWFLYLVFALWLVYTLVIIYHWLKYSHDSHLMFPAIGLHLIVSFGLMVYALTGTIL